MGFDLSGMNPKIHKHESEYKYFKEDSDLWKDENAERRKKYFQDMERYHEDNPGVYFRNNVWWWRPLWSFVCNNCDFMTEEQFEAGSFNDGKEIDQETAAKIGTQLEILLADGTVDKWEERIRKENKELEKSDDKEKRFFSSYPFSRENVENFAKFCLESGGFIIC
jgi:hypothetical protein